MPNEVNETPKVINGDKPETTALATVHPAQTVKLSTRPASFAPTSFEQAMRFAELMAQSDMVPKDMKGKPQNILIAMQMGSEVGLSPTQAVQNIAPINGRPSLWGDGALAVVQAHPAYEDHEEYIDGEGDKMVAVCRVKRKGQKWHEVKFSVDDAKRANLWDVRARVTRWKDGQQKEVPNDSPWYKYPKRMLQMRARGFALRDKFADALRGLNIAEEIMDYVQSEAASDIPEVQTLTAEVLPSEDPNKSLEAEATELLKALGKNTAQTVIWLQKHKANLAEHLPALREEAKRGNHGTTEKSAPQVQGNKIEADQPPAKTVDPAQTWPTAVEDPLEVNASDAPKPQSQSAKKATTRSLF